MTLLQAIPVLASLDLSTTSAFYDEKLGFKTTMFYPDYLGVERDGLTIHFWLTKNPEIPKQTSCYIYVNDIEALYAEYEAQKVIHPNGKLKTQDYGLKEFAILDSDGNLIKFGQPI